MVNAFWLDEDLEQAAAWHVDRHVLSAILENHLTLTTALALRGHPSDLPVTHEHHPLPDWAAQHPDNWQRLHDYVEACHEEWRYRWDNHDSTHGSWEKLQALDVDLAALDWPGEPSPPPQLTGDWEADTVVDAYRLYYANDKRDLFAWTKRQPPAWLDDYRREEPAADTDP
jgi:hypothetical protein